MTSTTLPSAPRAAPSPALPQFWSPISKKTVPDRYSEATASNCNFTRWEAPNLSSRFLDFSPLPSILLLNRLPSPTPKPTSHSPEALKSMALAFPAAPSSMAAASMVTMQRFLNRASSVPSFLIAFSSNWLQPLAHAPMPMLESGQDTVLSCHTLRRGPQHPVLQFPYFPQSEYGYPQKENHFQVAAYSIMGNPGSCQEKRKSVSKTVGEGAAQRTQAQRLEEFATIPFGYCGQGSEDSRNK